MIPYPEKVTEPTKQSVQKELQDSDDEEDLRLSAAQLELLGIFFFFVLPYEESWTNLPEWCTRKVNGVSLTSIIRSIDGSEDPLQSLAAELENSSFSLFVHELLTHIGARSKNSSLAPIYNMDYISTLAGQDVNMNATLNCSLPMRHDPLDVRYLQEYFAFKAQKEQELRDLHSKFNI